jgi:predicted glycoside hydrolase/deacetylase ChbG (UPF0249 family)
MDGISLVIRADDFGLYHAANQAVEEGFETGLLTCATLAGAGPWLREAVELSHAHPGWEVGLEVQLHCDAAGCAWGPVAGRALVPSLVTQTGDFPPRLSDAATADDVRREFDAQINRLLQHGVRPTFLECASNSPLVDQALAEFSGAYGIPARMTNFGLRPVDLGGGGAALAGLDAGAYLWVVRPAQDTPESWALWPSPGRHQADARAVCNPELAGLLERHGVRRCRFQEYFQRLA